MVRIALEGVSVSFPIYDAAVRSIRHELARKVGGRIRAGDKRVRIDALREISLELKDGDRVGLLGHNGAGKTTLLKVLSGVYEPVIGEIEIDGTVTSLTDIMMGMDPEATGKENILMRCVFMGMTFREAKACVPIAAEFSELGDYLALPVRTYSTGMMLRLAYSVTAISNPEIIIMDEFITAGDARFIEKARQRSLDMVERAKIMVIATHSTEIIKSLCTRAVWLDRGSVRLEGPVEDVLQVYAQAA